MTPPAAAQNRLPPPIRAVTPVSSPWAVTTATGAISLYTPPAIAGRLPDPSLPVLPAINAQVVAELALAATTSDSPGTTAGNGTSGPTVPSPRRPSLLVPQQ